MSPSFSPFPWQSTASAARLARTFFLLMLALLLHGAGQAQAASYVWNGSVSNQWSVAANWTPAGVPGTSDGATIGSGTLVDGSTVTSVNTITLNGASQLRLGNDTAVGTFNLNGGSILKSGNVTVSNFNWTAGSIGASVGINSGSKLTLSGAGAKNLYDSSASAGGFLNNFGVVLVTGTGALSGDYGSFIVNQSGGTFTVQGDSSLSYNAASGPPTFENLAGATFTRNTSTGVCKVSWPFNNEGTVNTQTGTLQLLNGGTSTGTYNTSSGARTEFSSGATPHLWNAGTTFLGAGRAAIVGGFVNVSTATIGKTGSTGQLEIVGGALGSTGDSSLSTVGASSLFWTGGRIGTTINVSAGGTFAISGDGTKNLYDLNTGTSGTINNSGTMTLTGNGDLSGGNSSGIRNKSGATFTVQGSGTFVDDGASGLVYFDNQAGATFTRNTSTAVCKIYWLFHNAGTVNTQTGTLQFFGGGNSTGTYNTSSGARIEFSGGQDFVPLVWYTGTTFIGAGRAALVAGSPELAGAVSVGKTGAPGQFEITGGTLRKSFNGTAATALSTVGASSLFWSGGEIGATVNVATGGTFAISGDGAKNLYDFFYKAGGIINNSGAIIMTGNGSINGDHGSTINNKSGGTFMVQGNGYFFSDSVEAVLAFNNQAGATFTRNTSTGALVSYWPFNNAGTVNIQTGTLLFNQGGTSMGTFNTASGAQLQFADGLDSFDGGIATTWNGGTTFIGAGRASLVGGTATLGGAVTVGKTGATGQFEIGSGKLHSTAGGSLSTVGASTLLWSSGEVSVPINIATAGIFNISGGGTFYDNDSKVGGSISNFGTINWNGGDIALDYAAVITNQTTGVFNAAGNVSFLFDNNSATTLPTFRNNGLLNVGGTGAAGTFSLRDVNYLQGTTGVLAVEIGGTSQGSYDVLATSDLNSSQAVTSLNGALTVSPISGYKPLSPNTWSVVTTADASRSGTFATVTSPFQATYSSTAVKLGVPATPNATALFVTVNPNSLVEGGAIATGTLTRNGSNTAALTVALTANLTGQTTVPASVTIAAGSSTATFNVTALNDAVADGTVKVTLTGSATGYNPGAAVLQVADNDVPTLTLSRSTPSMTEGSAAITGTVTRNTPTTAALTVNLSASSTGQLTIPASVVIPAGSTSNTFALTAVDDGITDGNVVVGLTAAATGFTSGTTVVTVIDNDTATLTLSTSSSEVNEGGSSATGTVTRTGATTSALTVNLAASPSGQLTIPASVTIPVGSTSATFTLAAVNDTIVDGNVAVTLTASATGFTPDTTDVTANDNDALLLTLSTNPTLVTEGGASATGTVSRTGATTSALTVSLSASPSGQLTVSTSVIIPAGSTSATFAITAANDTIAEGSIAVTLTAAASGFTADTTSVTVTDNDIAKLTLSASPTSFSEGAVGTASTGTVTRNTVTTSALTVNLASGNTAAATVPASVVIPAGSASATFAISAVNDIVVDGTQTSNLTASATGLSQGTVTVSVTDNDTAALRLTVSPASFDEDAGSSAATGTITRNTVTTSALTVSLSSSDTSAATVPVSVVIPAGSTSVTFRVAAVNNSVVEGDQVAIISATATGLLTAKFGVTAMDDELEQLFAAGSLASLRSAAVASGSSASCTSTSPMEYLDGNASVSSDYLTLRFSGALSAAAKDPSHVVAVNGQAAGINMVSVSQNGTVTIYLNDNSLRFGDQVVVFWRGLRDAEGASLSGQSDALTAR